MFFVNVSGKKATSVALQGVDIESTAKISTSVPGSTLGTLWRPNRVPWEPIRDPYGSDRALRDPIRGVRAEQNQ